MNWGAFFSWSGIALSALASIGYLFAGDVRRALYFACAAAITLTVVWK
jgi:hypothetical protein